MTKWLPYETYRGTGDHTVRGLVVVLPDLESPQLGNCRDILVCLPPDYLDERRRFPVVYMHDGQNLFDERTSFVGEWGVDKTMLELRKEGLEAIVVGIPNIGDQRMSEYSPFWDRDWGGGEGNAYLEFVIKTIKPLIDKEFRTLPGPPHTFTIGSSMGGLISLYAKFRHPEIFGGIGAMSPSLGYSRRALFSYVRRCPPPGGRIYMDIGMIEMAPPWLPKMLVRVAAANPHGEARVMHRLLIRKGFAPGKDLLYVEDPAGIHHESAWRRRLPNAIRFLMGGSVL